MSDKPQGLTPGWGSGPCLRKTMLYTRDMATVDYPHISRGPDDVPLLTGTGTKVVEIVLDHLAHGADADEIQQHYPYLTLGQIHCALAYYYDHQEELDNDIARRLRKVDDIQSQLGDSAIAHKLRARKAQS